MRTGINRRQVAAGLAVLAGSLSVPAVAAQPVLIYADGPQSGWWVGGWSKQETVEFDGQKPVRVTMEGWNAFTFQTGTPVKADQYQTLTILMHGGDKGRQEIKLSARLGEKDYGGEVTLKARKGQWIRYDVPLKDLKITGDFDTIFFNNKMAEAQLPFYLNFVLMQ